MGLSAALALLAASTLSLTLTDVSCSGATTAYLLGPWRELPASRLSSAHHACAPTPWMTGLSPAPGQIPYHPTKAGMTAVAAAFAELIEQD